MIEAYLPILVEVAIGFISTLLILYRKIDKIEVKMEKQDIRIDKLEDILKCQIPKTQKY